uniref:ARAD1D01386p n=1 Tax=Blastobotrys adeninivorans TaxID=409370 RepID=A0A060TCQ1_BLAAD
MAFSTRPVRKLAQPRVLAHFLISYAKDIDSLDALGGLVEQVLLVRPEHYPMVGKYLLMAIEQVLGRAWPQGKCWMHGPVHTRYWPTISSSQKRLYTTTVKRLRVNGEDTVHSR